MGRLEDANSRLYQPHEEGRPAPRFFEEPKKASLEVPGTWEEAASGEKPPPAAPRPTHRMSRFHWILVGVMLLGIASVLGVFFFAFEKDVLSVTVLVKERAEAGEKVKYQIVYKNVGQEDLKDLELSFTYPTGAKPLNDQVEMGKIPRTRILLSDLPKGRQGTVELEARLFGKENEVKKAEAVILYRPEASTSRFVAKATTETTLVRVPLVLTVNVPQELVSGQVTTIVLDYASNAESLFENVAVGVTYPPGFEPTSFDPKPTVENSVWSLGAVSPGDSGKISITGKITGAPSEVKTFGAMIGLYNALLKEWTPYQTASVGSQLSTPLLSIEQRINESRESALSAGEALSVRLHYKNTLDIPLKNISLEVALKARSESTPVNPEDVLDFRSLNASHGFYNGTTKRIVWNPASASELALIQPHGEGDLFFSVRLNSLLGVDLDFKDLVVESLAGIRAGEIPAGFEGVDLSSTDSIEAKVIAKTVLSSLALYRNQYIANSGPLPPKVGQKTTYAIFWQLSNNLNDVRDVEVRAKLSPGALWENHYVPEGSALSYDASSGTIIWRVGILDARAGRAKPAPLVAYRVSITPGLDQFGHSPLLVGDIEVHGRDTFTGEEIQLRVPNITTELKGDPTTNERDWSVVK